MTELADLPEVEQEMDKVDVLHWWHFAFVLFAVLSELLGGYIGLIGIPKVIIILLVYKLFFKIKEERYYSFWSFAVILQIYFLISLKDAIYLHGSFFQTVCYLAAAIILGIEMYILSSPIYYPLIMWWNYDFRYRDDIKINAEVNEEKIVGRLTDLRRNAGCVAFFEELHTGTVITIKPMDQEDAHPIKGEIVSRRQYSLGRPYTYGVRFHLTTKGERDGYFGLVGYWQRRKSLIRELKIGNSKSS